MHVQVDDCIAKFLYMKGMTAKVKHLKDEGKPMPKDYQQLEQQFGECCHAATALLAASYAVLLGNCILVNAPAICPCKRP